MVTIDFFIIKFKSILTNSQPFRISADAKLNFLYLKICTLPKSAINTRLCLHFRNRITKPLIAYLFHSHVNLKFQLNITEIRLHLRSLFLLQKSSKFIRYRLR